MPRNGYYRLSPCANYMSCYISKRAAKRGCASQRHDITYINSKYKVVFIVKSGLDVARTSQRTYKGCTHCCIGWP